MKNKINKEGRRSMKAPPHDPGARTSAAARSPGGPSPKEMDRAGHNTKHGQSNHLTDT
jgi:hypothetical protein